MPEALTESFCERCGTRYEFKAPTRLNPLRKTRGLVSGLRNYIMSQDALSDAVGDAMRSEEESLAAQQLEAFHESFNFCIDCRQYTCVNCWNHEAGRCRACAPIAGTDDLLERFEASFQAQHPDRVQSSAAIAEPSTNGAAIGGEAWPETDLPAAATNGHAELAWPEAELIGSAATEEPATEAGPAAEFAFEAPPAFEPEPEPEVVAEVEAEPEPELVAEVEAEPEPEVVAEAEPEPIEARAEPETGEPVAQAEPEWPAVAAIETPVVEPEPEWEPIPEPLPVDLAAAAEPTLEPQPLVWEADTSFELLPEETRIEFVEEPLAEAAEFFEASALVGGEVEPERQTAAEVETEPEPIDAATTGEWVVADFEPEPEVVAEAEPEPESEVVAEVEPEVVAEAEPEPEPEVVAEVQPEVVAEVEPEVVAEAEPEPESEVVAEVQPEVVAEAEPEPESEVVAEVEPEVVAEAEPEPEPEVVAEAEPEPEPEPEPLRPTLRPISDTILHMPRREPIADEPRVAAEADDPAVAARRAQLDLLGLGDPGEGPVAPTPRTVLPYRSSGASAPSPSGRVGAAGTAASGSFWDASAREVASAMSQVGVQNCGQCGLSLSASARFCRRCGTRQARSA